MFRTVSDLHLEYEQKYFHKHILPKEKKDSYFKKIVKPDRRLNLILAGDTGHPNDSIYEHFIDWTAQNFKKVFMVKGNHEYYSYYRKTPTTMNQFSAQIDAIVNRYDNFFLLDRNVPPVELEDDWVVMGVTLWTFIPPEKESEIQLAMNDFRKIYKDDSSPITPRYQNEWLHRPDLDYLNIGYLSI